MRKFILAIMLFFIVGTSLPTTAHASFVSGLIEIVRKIFEAEDMTNTDWNQVRKDLSADKLLDALEGKAPKKPAADKNNQAEANQKKEAEPHVKVRPAQYLLLSFFVFFIVIAGVLMLWMMSRR